MKSIFFSETVKPKACLFSMQQCYMVLYKDPAIDAPGGQSSRAFIFGV